jgi:hypothetical protein
VGYLDIRRVLLAGGLDEIMGDMLSYERGRVAGQIKHFYGKLLL